jgi:general secretion pathway protein G
MGSSKDDRARADRERPFGLAWSVIVVLAGVVIVIHSTHLCGCGQAEDPQAKVAAAKADVRNIVQALQRFRQDAGRYPTESEGLNALNQHPPGQVRGNYFDHPPIDPWGRSYIYEVLPAGGCRISCTDPDPRAGTNLEISQACD